jgi:catechol 2,3-dioxygenase-like lactoylglutathione lyase family enzyme
MVATEEVAMSNSAPLAPVRGAHHVSIVVADVERSRAFYGGVLGLPEIDRPEMGLGGAWFQAGPVQLHLIVPPPGIDVGARPEKLSPIAPHLAFAIERYEATRDGLQAAGLEVLELGAAVGQMWVADPDGNIVELIAPRA